MQSLKWRRHAAPAAAAVIVIGVVARCALIAAPFSYIPDVFYYDTQAAKALLIGSNPYGHPYAVPPTLATAGAGSVFAYLPGVVEFLTPFAAFTDVRVGLVICDVLVAAALFSLKGRWSWPIGAAYMLLPTSILFSTWYPNDTLVGMAFLGLSIATRQRGNRWVSSALLGASLASSQLVWLLYPFILLTDLRGGKVRESVVAVLIAAAAVTPFLLWNPAVFLSNTVSFQFSRPVQAVLTAQPFGVNVNPTISGLSMTLFGATIPLAVRVGVALAAAVLLLWKSSASLKALFNGSLFVLVGIFVLPNDFSWWYLELPLMTLMVWAILSAVEPQTGPDRPRTLKARPRRVPLRRAA